uniref:Uncharacterized protein n=1 Tax=Arundo donax TaxID=35708 RepID=A0A0A9ANH6_ARUDO
MDPQAPRAIENANSFGSTPSEIIPLNTCSASSNLPSLMYSCIMEHQDTTFLQSRFSNTIFARSKSPFLE